MFWTLSPVLLVVAALFVIVPLWRQTRRSDREQIDEEQQDRDAANLAIFEERLGELQAEFDEGAFDKAQFESLKAELERSLLSDVSPEALQRAGADGAAGPARETAGGSGTGSRLATWGQPTRLIPLLLAVLIVPPASYFLYEQWGFREDLAFTAVVQRSQDLLANPEPTGDEIMGVLEDLRTATEEDPENGWAWYYIARHLVQVGEVDAARSAFERAAEHVENEGDRAVILGQWAQVEYLANDREMTAAVQDIINRTQRINPNERSILQLQGSDAYQNGDYQGAITYWQRLLSIGVPQQQRQFIEQAVADAREQLQAQGGEVAPAGPSVQVEIALAQGVTLAPDTRVFVSAQDAGAATAGPPLAATALTVADLPATVELGPAQAVGPRDISSAGTVHVVATASLSGTADVQSGDWQGRAENIAVPDDEAEPAEVRLEIDRQVE